METGETQLRDTPSFEAVGPEEAMKALFAKPEWKEIERGQFMMILENQIEKNINDYTQAQMDLIKAENIKRKIASLEANEFGVRFYLDQMGRLMIDPYPKKPAGFSPSDE